MRKTLLNAVSANTTGDWIKLDKGLNYFPLAISGITDATVTIQGTIASDSAIDAGTATGVNLDGGEFTSDTGVIMAAG